MDQQSMDKSNEVVKTNDMQELNLDDLDRVSGGKRVQFYAVCSICGRVKDDPATPDELRCHCK